jgi:hypothetical protein
MKSIKGAAIFLAQCAGAGSALDGYAATPLARGNVGARSEPRPAW